MDIRVPFFFSVESEYVGVPTLEVIGSFDITDYDMLSTVVSNTKTSKKDSLLVWGGSIR